MLADVTVDIQCQFPARGVEINYLNALWQNHSEKIVSSVRRKVDAALLTERNVAIVYDNCRAGGELDVYPEQEGVTHIPVPHCYELCLGKPILNDEIDTALGTFFLTDYMDWHSDRAVIQGLGPRKQSQLWDRYFGNYTRVLRIARIKDSALQVRAEQAAQELWLAFEKRLTGYEGFSSFVKEAQPIANPPAT